MYSSDANHYPPMLSPLSPITPYSMAHTPYSIPYPYMVSPGPYMQSPSPYPNGVCSPQPSQYVPPYEGQTSLPGYNDHAHSLFIQVPDMYNQNNTYHVHLLFDIKSSNPDTLNTVNHPVEIIYRALNDYYMSNKDKITPQPRSQQSSPTGSSFSAPITEDNKEEDGNQDQNDSQSEWDSEGEGEDEYEDEAEDDEAEGQDDDVEQEAEDESEDEPEAVEDENTESTQTKAEQVSPAKNNSKPAFQDTSFPPLVATLCSSNPPAAQKPKTYAEVCNKIFGALNTNKNITYEEELKSHSVEADDHVVLDSTAEFHVASTELTTKNGKRMNNTNHYIFCYKPNYICTICKETTHTATICYNYKVKLCPYYNGSGCQNAGYCVFAHGREELRKVPEVKCLKFVSKIRVNDDGSHSVGVIGCHNEHHIEECPIKFCQVCQVFGHLTNFCPHKNCTNCNSSSHWTDKCQFSYN